MLFRSGFVDFVPGMELKPGTKIYRNNRGKSVIFAVIGKEHINSGAQIVSNYGDLLNTPHTEQQRRTPTG